MKILSVSKLNNKESITLFREESKKSENSSNPDKKNNVLTYSLTGLAALGAIGIASYMIHNSKKVSDIAINSIKAEMEKFPKDISFRKSILKALNKNEEEYSKLRSVIGEEEFTEIIKKLQETPEIFTPGSKVHLSSGEVSFPNKERVNSFEYGANLHIHTMYSDGKYKPEELLNDITQYADKRVAKFGKDSPFIFSITDHDSVRANKEIIELILQNPKKYANIRFIPGIEFTTTVKHNNQDVHIHMLTYGINPCNRDLETLLLKDIESNVESIKNVINKANLKFNNGCQIFDAEELFNSIPALKYSRKDASGFTKDYLQFKLIHNFLKCQDGFKDINIDIFAPVENLNKVYDYKTGQKYWEGYYEELKKILGKDKNYPKIPEDIINKLNEIEANVNNPSSDIFIKKINFNSFENTVKGISELPNGVMGVAHPGVVFPINSVKSTEDTVNLYKKVYNEFKNKGGDKAIFAEDFYQVYYNNQTPELLSALREESKKHNLLRTGGLDTHASNFTISKY